MSPDRPPTPGLPVIEQLLRRAKQLNDRAGFLAWDPEKLAQNPIADPGLEYPRLSPPTPTSPRLFLSYGWARDEERVDDYGFDMWMDAFAGSLFNSGYEIVFDRDPRNFGKNLPAAAVLIRMNDCNVFVPIISEAYVARIDVNSPLRGGWAAAEWNHACKAEAAGYLAFIGIWHSGPTLPPPLSPANTVDIRDEPIPWAPPIREMFPAAAPGCRGIPRLPSPDRPPDPPHWPAYRPYASGSAAEAGGKARTSVRRSRKQK